MADRRFFLALLFLSFTSQSITSAFAKEGGEGGEGGEGSGKSGEGSGGGREEGGREEGGREEGKGGRDEDESEDDDDDKIREAVKIGEAEPLGKILSVVRRRFNGQVVKIRLTGKGKNLVYRIRLIDKSNKLIEVRVNAKTANIMGSPGLY